MKKEGQLYGSNLNIGPKQVKKQDKCGVKSLPGSHRTARHCKPVVYACPYSRHLQLSSTDFPNLGTSGDWMWPVVTPCIFEL